MHLAFSRKFARYLRGLQSHISNQFSQICATTADLLDLGEFDDATMHGTQQDNALSLSQLRRLLKNCTLDPKSSHWIYRTELLSLIWHRSHDGQMHGFPSSSLRKITLKLICLILSISCRSVRICDRISAYLF